MGNGGITADIQAYELPGVPWTSFFTSSGHAIHGTYWHQNYGTPMSRGCVNVPTEIAKWIFRWTTPVAEAQTWEQRGRGTLVEVTG
jgi:lipoprotein-anchoring transpeptidase ErfK/SrfK